MLCGGLFGEGFGIEKIEVLYEVECSSKGAVVVCCSLIFHPTKTREAGAMSSPNVGLEEDAAKDPIVPDHARVQNRAVRSGGIYRRVLLRTRVMRCMEAAIPSWR